MAKNKKQKKQKTIQALILFSGGLDSMLAAKILQKQGINITLICFTSYFFSSKQAEKSAVQLKIPLRVIDISDKQLTVVKGPTYGRGRAFNPCIDCHILMFKCAKTIMETENFDLVASGEVLGQRPMSQNSKSLKLIEKESGLTKKLLRPLSAQLLEETDVEREGLVNRAELGAIAGRSRQPQIKLAKQFGIAPIPQPAGGCILTDKNYAQKLARLFEINPTANGGDVKLMSAGRIFYNGRILIVVARNQAESEALLAAKKTGDIVAIPENFPGPTVLIRNFNDNKPAEINNLAKEYILRFSKKPVVNPRILIQ